MTKSRCLLHWAADGSFHWFASPGIEVICVDERAPRDRVYAAVGKGSAEMFERVIEGEDPVDVLNDIEGREA